MPGATCLICDEHCGMVPVSGGFLVDEPLVVGFHVPPMAASPTPYLGHVLVTPGARRGGAPEKRDVAATLAALLTDTAVR